MALAISSRFPRNPPLVNSGGLKVEDVYIGCLVQFIDDFESETIPNVGIVLGIISFDELVGEELGRGIVWYSVQFGDVDMVVSSEMIILMN